MRLLRPEEALGAAPYLFGGIEFLGRVI